MSSDFGKKQVVYGWTTEHVVVTSSTSLISCTGWGWGGVGVLTSLAFQTFNEVVNFSHILRHQSVSHRKNEFVRNKNAACCSWTSNCRDPHRHCGQLLEACKSNHAIVCVQFPRPVRHRQSHLDICPSVAMALGISEIRRFSMIFWCLWLAKP